MMLVLWIWLGGAAVMAGVLLVIRRHPEAPPIPKGRRLVMGIFCLALCALWFVGPLAVLLERQLSRRGSS